MNKDALVLKVLKEAFPDARCELKFTKDYELLMAVVLSAQTTDKRVNMVTEELFKYNLEELAHLDLKVIEDIIKPIGTYKVKALYINEIANILVNKYNSKVPSSKKALLSMPGVGIKTYNVVASNLFNVPCIAVDTHVSRVAYRLGLCLSKDPVKVEASLKRRYPKDEWINLHHRMVLYGRYICKARSPLCERCQMKGICKYFNQSKKTS